MVNSVGRARSAAQLRALRDQHAGGQHLAFALQEVTGAAVTDTNANAAVTADNTVTHAVEHAQVRM